MSPFSSSKSLKATRSDIDLKGLCLHPHILLSSFSLASACKRVQIMSFHISLGSPVFQRGCGEIMTIFSLLDELFFKAGNSCVWVYEVTSWEKHTNHEQLNISQKLVWELNKMKLLRIKVCLPPLSVSIWMCSESNGAFCCQELFDLIMIICFSIIKNRSC